MRRVIIILTGFVLIITVSACSAGRMSKGGDMSILPMGDTLKLFDGTTLYALPRTVIDIEVIMDRKVSIPGPYSRYAKDMLGIADAITVAGEEWSLREVRVSTHDEADPAQLYVIGSSSLMQSNALQLRRWGLTVDPGFLNASVIERSGNDSEQSGSITNMGSDKYYNIVRDTAFRVVNIDSGFVRIPYLVERKVQLSLEQQADRAAKLLLELRDGKHMILTGETNVFPQDRAAIDEINRLDAEYTALFAGKRYMERRSFRYHVIPVAGSQESPFVICKWSPSRGVLPSDSADGSELFIDLKKEAGDNIFRIVDETGNGNSQKQPGLYYRMPQVTTFNIQSQGKVFNSGRMMVYQFGQVLQLPSNIIIGK